LESKDTLVDRGLIDFEKIEEEEHKDDDSYF
jgi:hypothetical protein